MLSRIEFFFAHIDYDQNDVKKTPIEMNGSKSICSK